MKKIGNSHSVKSFYNLTYRIICIGGILLALTITVISTQTWPTKGWEVAATPGEVRINSGILDDFNTWFTETKNAKASPWYSNPMNYIN